MTDRFKQEFYMLKIYLEFIQKNNGNWFEDGKLFIFITYGYVPYSEIKKIKQNEDLIILERLKRRPIVKQFIEKLKRLNKGVILYLF